MTNSASIWLIVPATVRATLRVSGCVEDCLEEGNGGSGGSMSMLGAVRMGMEVRSTSNFSRMSPSLTIVSDGSVEGADD